LGRMHVLTRRIIQTGPTAWRKTDSFHAFLSGLLKLNKKLRILIVGANSDGNIPDAEIEAATLKTTIESDLRQIVIPHEITLYLGAEANFVQVSEALRSGRYHIFHYAGHGRYNDTLPEISGLILQNDKGPRTLTAADLNMLVRNTELQLIFLSCCLGARSSPQAGRGDFHGMLEALATADVPIVIGYRWTVADSPALQLAQNFYETLWRTFSPSDALLEARIRATMGPMGRDDETWASPVLIMQNE
jgi:CHAT domain-containing protein